MGWLPGGQCPFPRSSHHGKPSWDNSGLRKKQLSFSKKHPLPLNIPLTTYSPEGKAKNPLASPGADANRGERRQARRGGRSGAATTSHEDLPALPCKVLMQSSELVSSAARVNLVNLSAAGRSPNRSGGPQRDTRLGAHEGGMWVRRVWEGKKEEHGYPTAFPHPGGVQHISHTHEIPTAPNPWPGCSVQDLLTHLLPPKPANPSPGDPAGATHRCPPARGSRAWQLHPVTSPPLFQPGDTGHGTALPPAFRHSSPDRPAPRSRQML